MGLVQTLAELSRLASEAGPQHEALRRALPLVAKALGADEVLVVYGNEAGFQCAGTCPDLGFADDALRQINRDLAERGAPAAFDVEAGQAVKFRKAWSRLACRYVAAAIPIAGNPIELLIAQGAWSRGLSRGQALALQAVLPPVALMLERKLDVQRLQRQRSQVNALANITRVMLQEESVESVLSSMAGSMAVVANMDVVTIDIVDEGGCVQARTMSTLHPDTEGLREHYQASVNDPAPVRDAVLITRKPMVFADAQHDERIPEGTRALFAKARIGSAAVFPLLAKDDLLGTLGVATHRRLAFSSEGVGALEGLVAQVAAAIKGIQLYRELADSREELQRVNQQLQASMGIEHHLARTDVLTGIPNRRFIDETLAMELARANRYGQDLAVVMADLDDLKEINDAHGHEAGDEILRFVAEQARQSCRQVDVVGRYGGDEFVFVLPATKPEEAAIFAERFREQLASKTVAISGGGPVRLTVSLGVAHWDRDGAADPAAIIRQADRAMYKAKASGRNRTVLAGAEAVHAA